MEITLDFIFDDDGWVIPVMSIDGEVLDDALPAERVARDDEEGLREAGLDPDSVWRRWEREHGGGAG